MRHILIIVLIAYGINLSAQCGAVNSNLDRVEKLIMSNELEWADSLLQLENMKNGDNDFPYRCHYLSGLLFYNRKMYQEAISTMGKAILEMDSLHLWDCENYLKVAYYISDSYIQLNKFEDSERIINSSLLKCINSYSTCIYAKKMYQLLLVIYKEYGYPKGVIEQVHNEIQKMAINIYASDSLNRDGEQIKDHFMFFYDYITRPSLSMKDSIIMNQSKGAWLYSIGEYDEALRLYEYVKMHLPKYDEQLHGINESLLVMYSSMAQTDKIDKLLPEMYEYSLRKKLDYDFYSLNVWVGHNLNQNGHFKEAQYYFQQCDSFLNTNKTIPDWAEKKKNVLSKMVFNCRSLSEFEKVIGYCRDFSILADPKDYDETFFVNYNQGLALRALEKYDDAIIVLEFLKSYMQKKCDIANMDFLMLNVLLGVCYDRTNKNNDFFECSSIAIDVFKKMQLEDKSLLGTLYNNLGKAYLQKDEYKRALPYLKQSADIQIEQTGKVYLNTQSFIDECKRKQK